MKMDMQPMMFENMHPFMGFGMMAILVLLIGAIFGAGYMMGRSR